MKKLILITTLILSSFMVLQNVTFASDPYTGVSNMTLQNDGTEAAPAINFKSDTDLGIYRASANTLGIAGTLNADTYTGSDVTLTSATTLKPVLSITNTNADANASFVKVIKNSASPADNDKIGEIQFYSNNSSGDMTLIGEIEVQVEDVTTANEDCSLSFQVMKAGTLTEALSLTNGVMDVDVVTANSSVSTGDIDIKVSVRGVVYLIKATAE